MFSDSCKCENPYLLLRIVDTVPLHLCRQREILQTCHPVPGCFRLESACLSGTAYLSDQRFSERRGGANFSANLHLPLRVTLTTACGRRNLDGEICIPLCACLRCAGCGSEQILPEVCIRVYDAREDCGGLALWFNLDVNLYVTRLCPTSLPGTPAPFCGAPTPRPHLPLYPELPIS